LKTTPTTRVADSKHRRTDTRNTVKTEVSDHLI